MEEEGVKSESTNSEMGLEEAKTILSSLSLASVTIGDFLVVMRSDFDLTIAGEPYTGLLLLLNITIGKYFCRIWNQTVATGIVVSEDQLMEVCKNHFGDGRPCLGFPVEGEIKDVKEKFLISQTPVPRRIATGCLKVLGKDVDVSVSSCTECAKLADSDISEVNECMDEHLAVDVEEFDTKSEIIDTDDFAQESEDHTNDGLQEDDLKKYACKECGYSFSTSHNLKKHIQTVHMLVKNFLCRECGYATSTRSNLIKHIESVHLKLKKHVCEDCGHATTTSSNLKRHIEEKHKMVRNHGNHICRGCGYAAAQKVHLKNHIESVHKSVKDNVCGECGFVASNKGNLKRHTRAMHEKIKPEKIKNHTCTECGYATYYKSDLKKHIEAVHENIRGSVCEECGYAASEKGALKRHIEVVHENIRNRVCGECGYAAPEKSKLKIHIDAVHKNIRDYACGECGYAASTKSKLMRHIEAMHRKT